MLSTKVNELKAALDQAHAVYEAKKARLAAAGLNSKARYEALKPLKAIEDAANAAYVAAAHGEIKKELTKIIRTSPKLPRVEARARRRVFMYTK